MPKNILPQARWEVLLATLHTEVPEIFDEHNHIVNCIAGKWINNGRGKVIISPIDGSVLGKLPMLTREEGDAAVKEAYNEFKNWSKVPLAERKDRVRQALADLKKHRDTLAYLLSWEIGKPVRQAYNSVDRCITGVEWYLEEIDSMMDGRKPMGLVSNIASWNYPMSVLMHAICVQALCGNSVIAKVPTDGGLFCLSLAVALSRRHGLPITLISGSGSELSHALIQSPEISVLNYVGGKSHARGISQGLLENSTRHMLEMEGVNPYGVWDFSNWKDLGAQIKKGYEYGKQRCTAYVRWVVQRDLFPQFLETYLNTVRSLKIGHPLLTDAGATEAPDVDFGPLINNRKVEELMGNYNDAASKGAITLYKGELNKDMFLPEQDISAYMAPIGILNLPKNTHLYYNEPFGPIDTILIVDRIEELTAEMNVSNGNLVSSIATDDHNLGQEIAEGLRGFKIGINKPRSRGDREEVFGGKGNSWRGSFVGGKYLVYAVTESTNGVDKFYGNFKEGVRLPEEMEQLVQ